MANATTRASDGRKLEAAEWEVAVEFKPSDWSPGWFGKVIHRTSRRVRMVRGSHPQGVILFDTEREARETTRRLLAGNGPSYVYLDPNEGDGECYCGGGPLSATGRCPDCNRANLRARVR